MTPKRLAATFVAMLALNLAGISQTPSELLQKGIHTQEAVGDLDGAIAIFRQVVTAASTNKPLAAQAQYQLVLCMLQKGDRAGAERELAALERNFGDMTDLVAKARKLIPGSSQILPEPWGEDECEQLNIKREGVATGEYLYYSVQTWKTTRSPSAFAQAAKNNPNDPLLQALILHWELKTPKSTHGITITVDRNTRQPVKYSNGRNAVPQYESDDDLGIDSVGPFAGPATDVEESVFLLRQLPLAVGYQTTIPVTSNAIAPSQLKLAVTGIESVQTPAGKFNCYKVSFASLGQTLWIGAEGKRPFVKFQSGNVQAELVKVWGPERPLEAVRDIMRNGGFGPDEVVSDVGGSSSFDSSPFEFRYFKRYLPQSEIADELRKLPSQRAKERIGGTLPLDFYKFRLGSLQTRTINGQQTLSCLMDYEDGQHNFRTAYVVWFRTENGLLEVWADLLRRNLGSFRWRFDPALAAIHIP